MNETLKSIAQRYSCRSFDGRVPEKEKLDAIALAAVQAPSAVNRQPWKIGVITDQALLRELDHEGMDMLSRAEDQSGYQRLMDRGGTMLYHAPCMFLICKKKNTDVDTGIVCENVALAATSLGLGSVICAMAGIPMQGPNGAALRERFGINEDWEFGICVLVGYATGTGKPHEPDLSKVYYV